MLCRAVLAALLLAAQPALAAETPRCRGELPALQKSVAEARLTAAKEQQVQALMEQIERACRENDDVVALAGIDQVRAILDQERKSG
jgi:hypothetical protein